MTMWQQIQAGVIPTTGNGMLDLVFYAVIGFIIGSLLKKIFN